ncbi:hypothetical protein RIF29_36059 [Crotalaria pallida]|uniref:Uncharacterized protein n=1 Tax=Crotalaria pallida TaxID=3830 RepID=A0AAN9ECV9_CROPI
MDFSSRLSLDSAQYAVNDKVDRIFLVINSLTLTTHVADITGLVNRNIIEELKLEFDCNSFFASFALGGDRFCLVWTK